MESSSDLPTTIIIRDIPRELFEDDELKENFTSMFHDIDQEIRIEFLKSFNRVRVHFSKFFVAKYNTVSLKLYLSKARICHRRKAYG